MTKEQLNELREYYTVKFPQGYQYSQARNDVIALLDYIAELESRLVETCDDCRWLKTDSHRFNVFPCSECRRMTKDHYERSETEVTE